MITKKDILHIAKLCSIEIKEDEILKFQNQLAQIIDYINILNEVDTENVDSFFEVNDLATVLREDMTDASLDFNDIKINAINTDKTQIKVNKVL
ncbi:MAG: Asp-tRNA(Asn)/Glu-tRNA(Gln) amidotransferase subunit GatC [Patescibacteria group bacterium]|jgi:aspartyl-tRNA(Asn)/glutamyl-tRNA(Gln) amidotransferase subunit C